MKHVVLLVLLLFAGTFPVFGGGNPKTENEYVKTEISLKQNKLKAGASGQVLFSLRPKKGIHVNLAPAVEVKLDSSDLIALSGKPEIPRDKKTDFLDPLMPIKQSFTLSKKTKPGMVALKGMLTYYYCSDAEGWCSKFKQPIEMKITVVQ